MKLPAGSVHFNAYLKSSVSHSIFVDYVTTAEVFALITSLKCNKSCGPDNISPQLVKDNVYYLCEPLTYLYNLSLSQGIVPDQLKIAKVIPVFKKGENSLASNYRPISLLSIFNKVLEKIVYKRLYTFLDKHKILYKHQFGFRKNHTTSLALLEVIDSCYKNLDMNNNVIGIYFDLQKAFDTVDHKILLHKLYNYGIRGTMYNWLNNYLLNRKQFTVVNNVPSKIDNITCGVPQGSVLGPLLFLIYINDMYNAVPGEKLKLFADDTNLFIFGPDPILLQQKANECLESMEKWFTANKLSLNIDKTCYTVFGSKCRQNVASHFDLYINNHKINRVTECKYLGIFIDDELKFDTHVDYVYKKIIRFTGILFKLRNVLPRVCLVKLYFAFVYPHILYGIEVYANTSKNVLDKLCKLNNKLLRIMLFKPLCTPIKDLYNVLHILPIPLLHQMQTILFVHKCMYHKYLLPDIFHSYFTLNDSVHEHFTRRHTDIYKSSVSSSYGQRNIVFYASNLWNNLPNNLKTNSTVSVFKKNVKIHLSNNC